MLQPLILRRHLVATGICIQDCPQLAACLLPTSIRRLSRTARLDLHAGSTAMQKHTFAPSDLDILARHARCHGLHPPYLTADRRLTWLAFPSSSERTPLVPHPPKHPPPPLPRAPLLHVAAQPGAPLPAARSILRLTTPPSANIVILHDPLRLPPSVLPSLVRTRLVALERVALVPPLPEHPAPPLLRAPLLHVAAQPAASPPAATSILGLPT